MRNRLHFTAVSFQTEISLDSRRIETQKRSNVSHESEANIIRFRTFPSPHPKLRLTHFHVNSNFAFSKAIQWDRDCDSTNTYFSILKFICRQGQRNFVLVSSACFDNRKLWKRKTNLQKRFRGKYYLCEKKQD